jgi:predicted component of type VI protein secretion system
VSVSRVYVPNEYAVWLSPEDRERYEGVEHEVIDELCAYLLEHARRENLIMASQPHIEFHTDERLALGEFGIQARLARAEQHEPEAPRAPERDPDEHGNTMIYSTSERVRAPLTEEPGRRRAPRALLVVGGRRLLVPPTGGTIGRSRDCEIVLEDGGISRRHARIAPSGSGWTIEDLGSTNGIMLDGRSIRGAHTLQPGDRLELGSTVVVFEVG